VGWVGRLLEVAVWWQVCAAVARVGEGGVGGAGRETESLDVSLAVMTRSLAPHLCLSRGG
jgi:hypothetical protein